MSCPIFECVLKPIDLYDSPVFRSIVSALMTALKREEHVLISCRPTVAQATVSSFIEYVVYSVFPATISVVDSAGNTRFLGRRRRATHRLSSRKSEPAEAKMADCPYMSNVCIVEEFDQVKEKEPILRVMKELAVSIDDEEQENVPTPFLLVAIVPETTHLPKSVVTSFSFHINIPTLPSVFPHIENSLYQGYDSLLEALKGQVFMHKEISIYTGRLVLRADGTPLVTSFLEVKTKLLLNKAVEDCAILHGRDYIIPDDVQGLFPYLVTHRLLLPGPTTFETCGKFIESVIQATPVPI